MDEGLIVDSETATNSEIQATIVMYGDSTLPSPEIALELRRLKNENIFFILLSLFQFILGLDAVSFFLLFIYFLIYLAENILTRTYIDC